MQITLLMYSYNLTLDTIVIILNIGIIYVKQNNIQN